MFDYIDLYRPLVEICGSCSLPPAKAKAAFVACHQHKGIIFGEPNAGGPLYASPPKPSGILNQAIHTGANRESNRQSNRQFNRQFYNKWNFKCMWTTAWNRGCFLCWCGQLPQDHVHEIQRMRPCAWTIQHTPQEGIHSYANICQHKHMSAVRSSMILVYVGGGWWVVVCDLICF